MVLLRLVVGNCDFYFQIGEGEMLRVKHHRFGPMMRSLSDMLEYQPFNIQPNHSQRIPMIRDSNLN